MAGSVSTVTGSTSLSALALVLMAACVTTPPATIKMTPFVPPLRPFTIEAVKQEAVPACRLDAPPAPRPLALKPTGCPADFAGCLDMPSAKSLSEYLESVQAWSRDAYSRCGVKR